VSVQLPLGEHGRGLAWPLATLYKHGMTEMALPLAPGPQATLPTGDHVLQ
jgi:hypothetical protein